MSGYRVEASRLITVADADQAFDRLITASLPQVFNRRYAAFPAIREVTGQPDPWGSAVGQTRTIHTADGGSLLETLTAVDRPHSYAYVLDEIRGPLRPFVRSVDGVWSVTPEDGGVRIGWEWTLHPKALKASPARLTMNVIGRMWKGYAERGLAELETVLR